MDWLASFDVNGISLSTNKQWVQFDVPVEVAEKLFKTDYHYYEHASTGGKNVACEEYARKFAICAFVQSR